MGRPLHRYEVNTMKKILLLIITIFLLSGCNKAVDTSVPPVDIPPIDIPNPNGYIIEPQILINSEHRYKQESWVSENVELKDSSMTLQGDSFFATIIFQGSISEEKLREAIKVEGYSGEVEATITPSEGKTVFYGAYRNLDKNKPYKLIISKGIADAEGKTLKVDIQKEIIMKADTTAIYTLVGVDGIYKHLGRYSTPDEYDVGNMNLTTGPKRIKVEFSDEVDSVSTENSIKDGLKNKALKVGFTWADTKTMEIMLEGFEYGKDEPCAISMNTAKDKNGNSIYGNLYFVVGKANALKVVDIKSRISMLITQFADKRYMAVQSERIAGTVVIDDTLSKSVYNMNIPQTKRIDVDDAGGQYLPGIPGINFIYSWLDSDNLILLDRNTGSILSYSTVQGSSKELFKLPKDLIKANIIEIAISPDKDKLAVAYETLPPGEQDKHDFVIGVFNMSGKSIYKGDNLFMPRLRELFGSTVNMKWLDNESLALEDNVTKENQFDFNIININVNTGNKTVMVPHAFMPVVLPGKNLMKVESFKDFGIESSIDIIKNGKKIKSFKAKPYQYDNFIFADENTLIYNERDALMVYYIDKGRSEMLGNGHIIGLTEDGSQVYYMTNYRDLYYID